MAAWFIPALVAFVLAGACVSWWVADHRWKEMRARAPGQAAWLAMFGSEDAGEVEAILRKVADVFHMRRRDTIFLRPEDTLGDLYRLSTGRGQIDSLEWVFLSKWLDAEYPTVREGLSAESTLRELVQACVAWRPLTP